MYYLLSVYIIIHPELLDRAQLTEQLSRIQSELAASIQIHYNTKCAVYDLCREVQNKGCMCLPQLIIGMLYALTHSFRDTMHNNSLKLSSTLVHECAVV